MLQKLCILSNMRRLLFIIIGVVLVTGCNYSNSSNETNTTVTNTNTNTVSNVSIAVDEDDSSIIVDSELIWLEYHSTQCNDNPWNSYESETLKSQHDIVLAYYKTEHDIIIENMSVQSPKQGFVACQACGCPTGYVTKVKIYKKYEAALLNLGFVKEETDLDINYNGNTNTSTDDSLEENDSVSGITDLPFSEMAQEDQPTQVMAQQLQDSLKNYFDEHGYYPNTLEDLTWEDADFSKFNYTPIGTTPANYYDLTVEYTIGKETLNP